MLIISISSLNSPKSGFSAPNFVLLEDNFATRIKLYDRLKFWGGGAIAPSTASGVIYCERVKNKLVKQKVCVCIVCVCLG